MSEPRSGSSGDTASAPRRSRMLTPAEMARNRGAVLAAAMALFLERGYRNVSVAQIASLAGVGGHVPSHYFGGKRMLFLRLRRSLEDGLLDRLAEAGREGAGQGGVAPTVEALTLVLLGDDWKRLERLRIDAGAPGGALPDWRERVVYRVATSLERTGEAGSPVVARQAARFLLDLAAPQLRERAAAQGPLPQEEALAISRANAELVRVQLGLWTRAWGG